MLKAIVIVVGATIAAVVLSSDNPGQGNRGCASLGTSPDEDSTDGVTEVLLPL